MRIKDIVKKRIVNFSSYAFKNLFVSPKKREELKKLINKEKKIVIFRKVVDHNILKNITKNIFFCGSHELKFDVFFAENCLIWLDLA